MSSGWINKPAPPNPEDHDGAEERMQTGFQGAIFDVDGVLVDSPHEAAWREALRELMESDWKDRKSVV